MAGHVAGHVAGNVAGHVAGHVVQPRSHGWSRSPTRWEEGGGGEWMGVGEEQEEQEQ